MTRRWRPRRIYPVATARGIGGREAVFEIGFGGELGQPKSRRTGGGEKGGTAREIPAGRCADVASWPAAAAEIAPTPVFPDACRTVRSRAPASRGSAARFHSRGAPGCGARSRLAACNELASLPGRNCLSRCGSAPRRAPKARAQRLAARKLSIVSRISVTGCGAGDSQAQRHPGVAAAEACATLLRIVRCSAKN